MKKTTQTIKIVFALFTTGVLIFLTAPPRAASETVEEAVGRLEKTYRTINDYHAVFQQETHQSSINRIEKGGGEVFFKKPGQMLWVYESPEAQKIILDGKNVWFYRPEEHQVMKNNYSVLPRSIVLDLLRGEVDLTKKFAVKMKSRDGDQQCLTIVLELIPHTYNPTLKKLLLHIDPKTWYITRSCLYDDFGNTTILQFSDITVNQGLKDSLFAFTPPPDADVFEPPKPNRQP